MPRPSQSSDPDVTAWSSTANASSSSWTAEARSPFVLNIAKAIAPRARARWRDCLIAAANAFGMPIKSNKALYPYGIYTIPEISFIGKTEEQLTDEGVPYEVGIAYFREIPVGRWGVPQDVANAVLYFASEEASFVTGQTLCVNGGMTPW